MIWLSILALLGGVAIVVTPKLIWGAKHDAPSSTYDWIRGP